MEAAKEKIVLRLLNLLVFKIGLKNLPKKDLAEIISHLVSLFKVDKGDFSYFDYFNYWQKKGFSIVPNHFYQPIPDLSALSKDVFSKQTQLYGIDMSEKTQLKFLNKIFPKYKKIYNKIPHGPTPIPYEFHLNNYAFDGVDPLVYYCIIRHFKPRKIIEVGSGWSTRIAAQACLENKTTQLISIEPYPQPLLKTEFPGFSRLIQKKVENVDFKLFGTLRENDVLFIDSSHTVKIGGDVNYLFLEILPRLKKGVLIHIHDIFFPYAYPKEWLTKEYRFWNEQYLLQAFLTFNKAFEVLFANGYMGIKYKSAMRKMFPKAPFVVGGSFWMRKK